MFFTRRVQAERRVHRILTVPDEDSVIPNVIGNPTAIALYASVSGVLRVLTKSCRRSAVAQPIIKTGDALSSFLKSSVSFVIRVAR